MTNARVIVELPDFAKGKTYMLRDNDSYRFSTPPITIPTDCKYASVYIHADGYVEGGLGDRLSNEYTNFIDIMEEIICGGDASCIGGPYHGMRNEDMVTVGPQFSNDLNEIRSENYNYLYRDGCWYVRENSKTDYKCLSNKNNVDNALIGEMKIMISDIKDKISQLEEKLDKMK